MSDKREQLCTAMESLDLGEVQRILDETPSLLRERLRPDAGRGGDVMSLAALTNSPELLELLHRRGGDVMENSNNPLNRAATKGNLIASMETLVRLGADVDQPAEDYGPPIIFAIEGGSLDSMRFLLEQECMIAGERNGESWDALKHAAIFNRRHPGMIELVLQFGGDVNDSTIDQRGGKNRGTALHNAAAKGDLPGVRLLLQHGADKEARDADGLSPVDVTKNRRVRDLLDR